MQNHCSWIWTPKNQSPYSGLVNTILSKFRSAHLEGIRFFFVFLYVPLHPSIQPSKSLQGDYPSSVYWLLKGWSPGYMQHAVFLCCFIQNCQKILTFLDDFLKLFFFSILDINSWASCLFSSPLTSNHFWNDIIRPFHKSLK